MAGEAKTSAFVLSQATVMIGATDKVFELTPAENSIGLVKNFTVTSEPTYTDLTQGVKNNIVYSVMTNNPVRATMEVYEFTSANMAYALGLQGADFQTNQSYELSATVAADDTTAETEPGSDVASDFGQGDWIILQRQDAPDDIHLAKLDAAATYTDPTLSLSFNNWAVPTGHSGFGIGDLVKKVNRVDVGSKDEQPFLGAKVVGILPESNEPVTLIFPKLRITRGFNMAFTSDNYSNMPFEFTPFELVSSDTMYNEFKGKGVAALFSGN